MCKHITNAQVAIRTQCCRKWYDCPQCHEEAEDHGLRKTTEMTFACKKCRKAFRKDLTDFDEADSFCPHCDNNFMIPAETPETKQLDAIADGTHEIKLPGQDGKILDSRMMRKEDIPQDLWDELDSI
ncbi:hypothetical protein CJU89_0996 [Yarrowia sp. B02]|nr:hypothetical protein CJU89_0996 [Yarrowia sp. B02]